MTDGFVMGAVLGAAFALQPPGTFHGGEPVARDGERWLALRTSTSGDAALVPTRLRVRAVEDVVLDAPGERTGREVSSSLEDAGIVAYLRGRGLRAGSIVTADRAVDATGPGDTPSTMLTLHARRYRLERRCEPAQAVEPDAQVRFHCRFVLGSGTAEQVLFEAPAYLEADAGGGAPVVVSDASAGVLFAGDLDRDGRLDLILDTTDHYNVSRPTLLLSSQARAGQLVGQAARYESVGC